jgi:hypothetical protein
MREQLFFRLIHREMQRWKGLVRLGMRFIGRMAESLIANSIIFSSAILDFEVI